MMKMISRLKIKGLYIKERPPFMYNDIRVYIIEPLSKVLIYSSLFSNTILIYDFKTIKKLDEMRLSDEEESILDIAFSEKLNHLAFSTSSGYLYILNADRMQIIKQQKINNIKAICFSPCSKYILYHTERSLVLCYSASLKVKSVLLKNQESISEAAFSPMGDKIICVVRIGAFGTCFTKIFDIKTGRELLSKDDHVVTKSCFSEDASFIYARGITPFNLRGFDILNGDEVFSLFDYYDNKLTRWAVEEIIVSSKENSVICYDKNGSIGVLNLNKDKLIKFHTERGKIAFPSKYLFSKCGNYVFSSHKETLIIWDVNKKKEIGCFASDDVISDFGVLYDNNVILGDNSSNIYLIGEYRE